jgi:hypothetical protein
MPRLDSTALMNSTSRTSLMLDGGGVFIRPTPLERAMGRLMRAPDHAAADGGDGGAANGSDGGDAGADAGKDAGADSGADKSADAGGDDAGKGSDAGDAGDDSTILANATAAGNGDADATDGEAGKDAAAEGDAEGKDAEGVPETYELTVTVKDAEGKDVPVEIDTELLAEATPILKELGLTNEAASKVAGLVPKIYERVAKTQADAFGEMSAQWAKDAKADPEIGGKHWAETEHLVARALDHFVGPVMVKNEAGEEVKSPFRQLLDDSKLGNHPDFIRAWRKVGADLGEDSTLARGSSIKAEAKPREEVMYPDDVPTKK